MKVAALQAQPNKDDGWEAIIKRVLSLTQDGKNGFSQQPFANRLDAILEAVVPSRKNPTHEKVLAIVNALIETRAIRRDEAAGVYDALLQRVSKYNSQNVQSNLDRLASDVREAVSQKVRVSANNLGSLAALNAFLATQPATVPRGQENYLGFISALRLLVSEVPSTEVYQSGPSYFLQSTRNGTQTVDLTKAFENMQNLWGVHAPTAERLSISSLLTPNTRLLLLLVSPFTDSVSVKRDSYLGYLLTLYREALGQAHLDERTLQEVTSVSKAFGDDNVQNLQATLNFLLTNRTKKVPQEFTLTPSEERILRFVQQSVSMMIMHDHLSPQAALDATSRNMEPTFYAENRIFVNKLMDYFQRAASISPDYFINAVLNPNWLPPEGFFTGVYDFPIQDNDLMWDDLDSALDSSNVFQQIKKRFQDEDTYIPPSIGAAAAAPDSPRLPTPSRGPTPAQSLSSLDFMNLVNNQPKSKNVDKELESLSSKFSRWKTYKKEFEQFRRRQERDAQSDDGMDGPDRFLQFEGSGMRGCANPFSHLRPQGGRY